MESEDICDGYWAGDSATRISVTTLMTYLLDILVYWHLMSQAGVIVISTKADYVAISEAVSGSKLKLIHYFSLLSRPIILISITPISLLISVLCITCCL